MIVDIIPTKKMPKNLSVLSYTVPKDLEASLNLGQIATIPIRNSTTSGVIVNIYKSKKFPYPLKNIINLASTKPIFTKNQLELFQRLADYYHVSASLFIHFNLPKLIKKDWKKVKQHKKTSAQTLVLVPRITDIDHAAKKLGIKKFTPIYKKSSRAENFSTYLKASTAPTLIGTRSAIFYPYTNLRKIIIYDEHSSDHKQTDMNPRYDAAVAAEALSKFTKARVRYISPSPSVLNYHKLNLKPVKLNHPVTISNLENELIKKNFSFISEDLLKAIKKNQKNIFLFVNKKGDSTSTSCKDCLHTFNCPTCSLPFAKNNKNQFICYYCDHGEDIPPFCPKCSGPNFHSTGLGIQKVETNLKKLFPKLSIQRLDKDSGQSKRINLKANIIIGTEFALDKIPWKKIDLIGIINADSLWHHSEFAASELAYQKIIKILTLAKKGATIIIQSFKTDHYIIAALALDKPELFYKNELGFRKKFSYPPFTNLIKLSYLHKSDTVAEKNACKLYDKIISSKKDISSPMPILRKKIRGKYKYNIILKLDNLDEFNSISKSIPNDWLIDIHPRTLLD
jgi:primosomal protein N' (replication factor Y) (superfamily II helicase)